MKFFSNFISKIVPFLDIGIPALLAIFVSIMTGKVIAVALAPAQFGVYSIQFAAYNLVLSLILVPVINAFKKFYHEKKSTYVIRQYLSIILFNSFWVTIVLSIINYFFYIKLSFSLILFITFYFVLYAYYSLASAYLNVESKHRLFGKYNFLLGFCNLILLILLIYAFNWRTSDTIWVAAGISAFLLVLIFTMHVVLKLIRAQIPLEPFKYSETFSHIRYRLLPYSLPLVGVAFVGFLNNYADRLIIGRIMNVEQAGLYSAAYGFSSKLSYLVTPILTYLSPVLLEMQAKAPYQILGKIRQSLGYHFLVGCIICIILYLNQNTIGYTFLSEQYKEAFTLIPIVAIGFMALNSVFIVEVKFYVSGDTRYILYHQVVGAILNVFLNLLLLPRYGIYGAAMACVVSFSVQFLLAYFFLFKTQLNSQVLLEHEDINDKLR